ncbi:MAG: NEAT domain-containing protein, partial [Ruminiclostridium sp.]|nr:NEAT domain-containing protein [Ruminiclostridium sp.]
IYRRKKCVRKHVIRPDTKLYIYILECFKRFWSPEIIAHKCKQQGFRVNEKNNLPDGKYTLYAQMIKTDRESFSMSNNAINHNVWLEVKDGEYYLTMQFKGMSIYNKFGYLLDLAYFDKGYTYNEFGIPKGTLVPETVMTTQKDSDGNDVIDQYNDADTLYPELL